MERSIRDKTVIVTGGAKGIGLCIIEKLLENGAKVVIMLDIEDKSGNVATSKLNEKHGTGRAVFIRCDVTKDLEKVSSDIISTYKTVDVLVNNAGWLREDSLKDTLNLNVVALIEWSLKFFRHMRTDRGGKGGTIINVASGLGFMVGPISPFYTASKHAVVGFTKSKGHAKTFAETGVRMVALCPGLTRTDLTKGVVMGNSSDWQDADKVGEAAVEVFQKADSGTAWLISGGNPILKVPDTGRILGFLNELGLM